MRSSRDCDTVVVIHVFDAHYSECPFAEVLSLCFAGLLSSTPRQSATPTTTTTTMESIAARIDHVLHALEDQGVGGRQMFKIARASVYAQILLAMCGSMSFVYGSIHPTAMALSLYAVVAMEIKAPRLLKIYACALLVLTVVDFLWLCTYASAISSASTGLVAETTGASAEVKEVLSLQYGIVAAGINNFFTLMPEVFAFFIRVASVALWVLMWSKGLLDGSVDGDMYSDPSTAPYSGGNINVHHGMEYQSEVTPGSPVRSGRITGAGGTFKPNDTFTVDGGYQDIDSDRDTLVNL